MLRSRSIQTIGKIIALAVILFTLSFLFFGILPYFTKEETQSLRFEAFGAVYIYLFLIFIWVYILAVTIYHLLVKGIAKHSNSFIKASVAMTIAIVFGIIGFNFGHLMDQDYDKFGVSIGLLGFCLLIGLSLYFIYKWIFRNPV